MDDNIIFYSNDNNVKLVGHTDYNDYIQATERRQELPGFDPEYLDIVDYILKITYNIWEDKGIGIIYDTYHNDIIVHQGHQRAVGIKGVVSGTLSTLHAFPDRRVIGEDVIWSEDKPGGFYSSHRVLSTGTNLGESSFGPATGKAIHFRTIADCAVKENRIYEEWLVRDNLWIVEQLGFDAHELAKSMAAPTPVPAGYGMSESTEGSVFQTLYQAKDDSVGEMMLAMHQAIFACKRFDKVKKYFAENANLVYIGNKQLVGHDEIQGTFVSLLASFPNAAFCLDRVTCNNQPDDTWHVSVRWRLRGLHEGLGAFGQPSGKPVEILGVNQYKVENGKITEGYMIFDGLSVLRQIYAGYKAPQAVEETQ